MSYGRFASITPDILARKGEARPWTIVPPAADQANPAPRPPLHPDISEVPPILPPIVTPAIPRPVPQPAMAGGAPPLVPAVRKCTIRMSAHDFERLGIIAVKDDTTRQHLLQQALADLLAAKERQYRAACRCMAADPCGACGTFQSAKP
jgi:predicted transcriptional regulator